MIYFQTNKVIIAYYPVGSGGKTLLNCLGISNSFCLQHINAPISSLDKFFLLHKRITDYNIGDRWNDLGLGCNGLFGADAFKKNNPTYYAGISYNSRLVQLFESGLYLPIVCHDYDQFVNVRKVFPNSKTIKFVNSFVFCCKRSDTYDIIKGSEWPEECPNNIADFPDWLQQEIKTIETNQGFLDVDADFTWDVEWFASADKTLNEVKKLYNSLSMADFYHDLIRDYYTQWKTKIYNVSMV